MKILRISLRNLASLGGSHTVDFTREPMKSTGLFSISGDTGSGKSTLLDALCLALYENTPRLTAAKGVKIPDAEGFITQKDPGNLLRRGTAEGFAEVAFVGVDQAVYTARWSIRRARGRSDGGLQNSEMVLYHGNVIHGTNGVVCQGGRKTEVLPVIAQKVGLKFEQFTRAVLLAQNDFAVFLKADDKERAEILQALTGTERFERLSVAVFERDRAEQEKIKALESQLQGNAPLSAELRAEKEAEHKAAEEAFRTAETKFNERKVHAEWLRRMAELNAAQEASQAAKRTAAEAFEAAAPRRAHLARALEVSRNARSLFDQERQVTARRRQAELACVAAGEKHTEAKKRLEENQRTQAAALEMLNKTSQAELAQAPVLLRTRELDAQLLPLIQRLGEASKEREQAAQRVSHLQTLEDALRKRSAKLEADRVAIEKKKQRFFHLAPLMEEAGVWIGRLSEAYRAITDEVEKRRDLEAKTRAAKAATIAFETGQNRTKALAEQLSLRKKTLGEAQNAVQSFDAEKLALRGRQLNETGQALGFLRERFATIATLEAQRTELENELTTLQKDIATDTASLADLQSIQIRDAEIAAQSAQEALAAAEAAVSDQAAMLRAKLQEHLACPVCGSQEHPFSTHPPVHDAALEAIRKSKNAKDQTLEKLRGLAAGLTARLETHQKLVKTKGPQLAKLRKQMDSAQGTPPQHPVAQEILNLARPEQGEALETQLRALETERRKLEEDEGVFRKATQARDTAQMAYDRENEAFTQAEKSTAVARTAAATAEQAMKSSQAAVERAQTEAAQRSADIEPLWRVLPEQEKQRFPADAPALIQDLKKDTDHLRTLDQALQKNAQESETLKVESTASAQNLATAKATLENCTQKEAAASEDHQKIYAARKELFGDRKPDAVEADLRNARARAEQQKTNTDAAFAMADKLLATAAESMGKAAEDRTAAIHACIEATAALNQWVSDFSERSGARLDRQELESLLSLENAWFPAEQTALDTLSHQVKRTEGQLQTHAEQVAKHLAERPTQDNEITVTSDLELRRQGMADADQKRIAAAAVISADDHRALDCADLTAQIAAQRLKAAPWARLNELVGSADGAKFRSIAQRRTLDLLLANANAQLDQLAARYRLERLPESLNLIVIDRDMADERRGVHSLSGGESFLVSLALALGLASLTASRIRIESLFIDEGFGSLDPATLNTAMGALMHLETQGRKVGVISHVREMTDAIPVQIRVVKGRQGSSRLMVPGAEPAEPSEDTPKVSGPRARGTAMAPLAMEDLAARLTDILRRERLKGISMVSTRSLREELGCSTEEFAAARDALGSRLISQGRSIGLPAE
ncbi:MAG: Nuclease SbcCD, gamma subunit [Verrucomicrobiota bacterium]